MLPDPMDPGEGAVDSPAHAAVTPDSAVEAPFTWVIPRHLRRDRCDRAPMTPTLPPPDTVDDIVHRFLDGTIAADAWTHPAHLFVCRHVLAASADPDEALATMRPLIQCHNERVGLRPGHGAYHETVTRYFVEAMAHTDPPSIAALLVEPALTRDAPLRHWTRDLLATDAARTGWVEPDLAPLPWRTDAPTT